LEEISHVKVFVTTFWILAEYSETSEDIYNVFQAVKKQLGEEPLVPEENEKGEVVEDVSHSKEEVQKKSQSLSTSTSSSSSSSRKLNIDGSYATQSASTETSSESSSKTGVNVPQLRPFILRGEYFVSVCLVSALTKLAFKMQAQEIDQVTKNLIVVDVLSIATQILNLGHSNIPTNKIDADSEERITYFIRLLCAPEKIIVDCLLKECRASLSNMLRKQEAQKPANTNEIKKEIVSQVDDLIKIRQLKKKGFEYDDVIDTDDMDVKLALGTVTAKENASNKNSLSKVYQLTGFSDPIYAEAIINLHHYDIILDLTIINQTPETMQNVVLELSTRGDLKLFDKPQSYVIAPHSTINIKSSIKISSTDISVIFGSIVYDIAGTSSSDKNSVVLNDIHLDITDYLGPSDITTRQFRQMWLEFEWENKISVITKITNVNEFLRHIVKSTNMKVLTPEYALQGECGFLSANLCAKSVFGEDALANISVEESNGKLSGFIRIRCKSQGIAVSLGSKITEKQKSIPKVEQSS